MAIIRDTTPRDTTSMKLVRYSVMVIPTWRLWDIVVKQTSQDIRDFGHFLVEREVDERMPYFQ